MSRIPLLKTPLDLYMHTFRLVEWLQVTIYMLSNLSHVVSNKKRIQHDKAQRLKKERVALPTSLFDKIFSKTYMK